MLLNWQEEYPPEADQLTIVELKLFRPTAAKSIRAWILAPAKLLGTELKKITNSVLRINPQSVIRNNQFYSAGVRHHLIDVATPKQIFSVAQFQKLAQRTIKDILKRSKLPIIVGGTGQYIDTLIYDLALPEVPPNYKLRAQFGKLTVEQLFEKLKKLDPERAWNIDRHNPRRLIRALEIIAFTDKPVPVIELGSMNQELGKYKTLWIGINPKEKDLRQRIKKRLDKRFKQGLIAEVKKLKKSGVSWKRLYDFGLEYRWISLYLQNKITLQEMKENLYRAIRQYSKRQMTWFKRNKKIHWLKNVKDADKLTKAFV